MPIYQFDPPLTGELIEELLLLANAQKNRRKIVTITSGSGAISIPAVEGGHFKLNLTGAATLTLDLTGLISGYVTEFDLEVTNSVAGLTFTNTIRWVGGAAPTSIAGTMVLRFYRVGADLFGSLLLNNV